MGRLRDVKPSDRYREQAARIEQDAQRWYEQTRGVLWAIAQDAERFAVVRGNLRIAETLDFPDAPWLVVFFTIDDEDTCTLQSVMRGEEVVGLSDVYV